MPELPDQNEQDAKDIRDVGIAVNSALLKKFTTGKIIEKLPPLHEVEAVAEECLKENGWQDKWRVVFTISTGTLPRYRFSIVHRRIEVRESDDSEYWWQKY